MVVLDICLFLLNKSFNNIKYMAKFKKEILEKISNDPDLYAAISKEMDVKPGSLGPMIARNGNSLNQYSIVTLVAEHLGMCPEDLLEEEKPIGELK